MRHSVHSDQFSSYTTSQHEAEIGFFFDFISPFGWLAAEQIGSLAKRFQRKINWHPFLLKVTVLDTMKLPPPLETPLKGKYLIHDIKRSLRYHGLEISKNPKFGFSPLVPSRLTLWTKQNAPEYLENLILALYREHWSYGNDISQRETSLNVAAKIGLKTSKIEKCFDDPEIKKALQTETSTALRLGIFGSPSFVIEDEVFWGSDRLPMIEAWLENGPW